jgi:hypothetical protein
MGAGLLWLSVWTVMGCFERGNDRTVLHRDNDDFDNNNDSINRIAVL